MRIPSATLSSNATAPPPSQVISSGGSFHAALAHASTENGSGPQPTNDAAMSSARATRKDCASDGEITAPSGSAAPVSSTVADPRAGQAQGTGDATEADASAGAGAAPAGPQNGVIVSAAVETASDAYFRQAVAGGLATGAGAESSSMQTVGVASANSTTRGLPAKQERAKAPTDPKKAAAVVLLPVVGDLGELPAVSLVGRQGAAHGQGSGLAENSAKTAASASANSAGAHGRTTAPIEGPGAGDTGSAALPVVATGGPQDKGMQTSAQPLEGGVDVSMLSGLPANSELTSFVDISLPAGNSMGMGSAAADTGSLKATEGASTTKNVATGTADAAWHGASDSQTPQGLEVDASKTGAGVVISKGTDDGAVQTAVQTLVTAPGPHENTTAQHATTGAPDSTHDARAADLAAAAHFTAGEGTPASGINSAKLIQTMGETEMHVGMHSVEFGDISIRTTLSQQQMVTEISLDHNDLSQTISSHLSTVQTKLGEEYGLHASIQVSNQGAPLSGGHGNSSQRDQPSPGRSSSGVRAAPAELGESVSSVVALSSAGSGHGLDITV